MNKSRRRGICFSFIIFKACSCFHFKICLPKKPIKIGYLTFKTPWSNKTQSIRCNFHYRNKRHQDKFRPFSAITYLWYLSPSNFLPSLLKPFIVPSSFNYLGNSLHAHEFSYSMCKDFLCS